MATIDMRNLGEYIREQRETAEVSLRQLAKIAGVSNPYLSQVERGLKKPSAEILGQIAAALRISAETLYVRAGLLEPRAGSAAVTDALVVDETLTERQRQVLLEIYAAFQSENSTSATAGDATTTKPTRAGATSAGARSPKEDLS
jgi:transcriptional regulator with XRE-family HTH domain